jgi:hypothetical protein
MTIEKRFHQRIDIEADVDIHILHRERHISAKAENITPYGIQLSTGKLSVPTGMLLELSVDIDGFISSVSGLVIWTDQQKIGLMFPQIQPALFTAAEALVDKNTPRKQKVNTRSAASGTRSKHILFPPEPQTQA